MRELKKVVGAYMINDQLMVMVTKDKNYKQNETVMMDDKPYRVSWTTRWWAGLGNTSKRLITLDPIDTRPENDYIPKKITRFAGVRF